MLNFLQRWLRRRKYGSPIILVSGLPRSGTSMLMKMLQAGGVATVTDQVRKADPDNPKGYLEYERVKDLDKEKDKSWLREHRGKAIKVISQLLKELPRENYYQVIFMMRDLDEVLESQAKMLERRGEEADREGDEQMKELFSRHLSQIRFWLRNQPNFDILEVEYREVVREPDRYARKLRDFLELEGRPEAMAEVVDPNLYRNRS